ncbi:MAG: type IV toxin-antitoxin system AbiEi family antitoxin domain-containing protein [Actinobacteria bacterium]|nr:type IV toxin-antitoxin system AbiEi family antitoxin domain-containing protein [Actinomycetota bacterium]
MQVVEVATPQLGLVAARQARACGVSASLLAHWTRTGRLERWWRGVYAIAGVTRTWERLALAACLAAGPGSVVSHGTAAFLHGMYDIRRPDRFELSVPRPRRPKVPGVIVHRVTRLPDEHRILIGAIPATSFDRTICDLAGTSLHERTIERIFHDGCRRDLTGHEQLLRCLDEVGPVAGAAALREILGRYHQDLERARSGHEAEAFAALIEDRVNPLPDVNLIVSGDGEEPDYEIDLGWKPIRFGYELDSRMFHTISPDVTRDRIKDRSLEARGWEVLRIPSDLARRDRAGFVAMVRADLRARGL